VPAAALFALAAAATWACGRDPHLPGGAGVFVDRAPSLGLSFSFDRARDGTYFMPESLAAGCAFLDYDGDGRLDVYIVNGYRAPDGALSHPLGANRLYRQGEDGRFHDVTAASGAGDEGFGMGCAVGDYDADGDLDLYVTNFGPDVLLRNEGDGSFTDVTGEAGLGDPRWGASAGFADLSGDGWLDLFVVNYLELDPAQRAEDAAGRPEYLGPSCCAGVPAALYLNRGDGTFEDASARTGIGARPGKGLGLAFGDLDGDGRLDVFVANDSEANCAWIQQADGTFVERATELGLAYNRYGAGEACMGVVLADLDGEGQPDVLVTNLAQETNTFYRNLGGGRFRDDSSPSGIGSPSLDRTGFGAVSLDFDLDLDLDVVCVGGRVLRAPERPGADRGAHWNPYAEEGLLYVADGAGRFVADAASCGGPCTEVDVGRALAVGDVDDDGDPDLCATTADGCVRLYVNRREPAESDWIGLLPVAGTPEREALGAVVTLKAGERRARREVTRTGSYLASHDPRVLFGLVGVGAIEAIEVRWPDGAEERFAPRAPGRYHALRRGTAP
jgi:hypothetical protein